MAVFNIDGCAQPSNILCDEIAEYDGAHRRFARAALPHQEDFLPPFAGVHLDASKPTLGGKARVDLVVVAVLISFDLTDRVGLTDMAGHQAHARCVGLTATELGSRTEPEFEMMHLESN